MYRITLRRQFLLAGVVGGTLLLGACERSSPPLFHDDDGQGTGQGHL